MPISFTCSCGHKFRTSDQNAGKQTTCPNCKTSITIPQPDEETTGEASEEAAEKSARKTKASAAKKPAAAKKRSPTDSIDDLLDLSDIGSFEAEPEEDEDEDDDGIPNRRGRFGEEDVGPIPVKRYEPPKREEVIQVIGAGVATILIGCVLIVLSLAVRNGEKIKPPTEFEQFKQEDISFKCEVPKGWKVEARGGSGNVPPVVKIEKGPISITYRASTSGAAIQDMAQAAANKAGEVSEENKPVMKVHEYQADKFKQEMPQYTELGKAERIDTGLGEGRMSTYTAAAGLSGKEIGYRVTLLTTQYQWNIVCKTNSKKDFEMFKPTFQRIIKSTGM